MAVYFAVPAVISGIYLLCTKTPIHLSGVQTAGILWMGVIVNAAGYLIWCIAINRGNTAKISNLAYRHAVSFHDTVLYHSERAFQRTDAFRSRSDHSGHRRPDEGKIPRKNKEIRSRRICKNHIQNRERQKRETMKNHCLPLLFAKRKIRREHRTSDFRYFLIPAKKPDRFSPLPIIPLCHPHFRR